MRLPDGDGLDFLSARKATQPDLCVVIMTAFADIRTAVDAIRRGAYDYLPKPFEAEHIDKILRNAAEASALNQKVASLTQLAFGSHSDVWQFDNMIGTDAMRDIFTKAERVANFAETTVLITGESGTGKGMLAKAIHRLSRRSAKPFVDVNCSAIPGQLIESEVFGYERGAFTDAKNSKPGLLEIADGGTVFLDEIGDMEVNLQSKLLKVIEDKGFRRLGGAKTVNVDVRIVAATSRDLQEMVRKGTFREDLYYRLSVIPITVPPLRSHRRSILPMAEYYLKALCSEMGCQPTTFSKDAVQALSAHDWPGNVRELRNAVERSIILSPAGQEITADALGIGTCNVHAASAPAATSDPNGAIPLMSLADAEKRLIQSAMQHVGGNRNKAADILKIHRTTLYKKIEEYGLDAASAP
jgi:DNA-binding NtrC family response regulator